MKKLFSIGILIVIVLLITVTLLPNLTSATFPITKGPKTEHDLKALSNMNIRLDIPIQSAKGDSSVAIQNAKATYPFLETAKDVKVEYHLLTDKVFQLLSEEALSKNPDLKSKGAIEKLPVFLISFKGVQVPSSGGPMNGPELKDSRTEFNVVVDATSNVPLFAFSYR